MFRQRVSKKVFSYDEAISLFPHVRDLTLSAVKQIEALVNTLESRDELETRRDELEEARERIFRLWAAEVQSLGAEVKGLWLVDWDSGDGYYCWRFPRKPSPSSTPTKKDSPAGCRSTDPLPRVQRRLASSRSCSRRAGDNPARRGTTALAVRSRSSA